MGFSFSAVCSNGLNLCGSDAAVPLSAHFVVRAALACACSKLEIGDKYVLSPHTRTCRYLHCCTMLIVLAVILVMHVCQLKATGEQSSAVFSLPHLSADSVTGCALFLSLSMLLLLSLFSALALQLLPSLLPLCFLLPLLPPKPLLLWVSDRFSRTCCCRVQRRLLCSAATAAFLETGTSEKVRGVAIKKCGFHE